MCDLLCDGCSHYHVVVVLLPLGQTEDSLGDPDMMYDSIDDFDDYSETFCDEEFTSAKAYITAEFAGDAIPNSGLFGVGGGSGGVNSPNDRADDYSNSLLCYSKRYTFFVRAYPLPISQVLYYLGVYSEIRMPLTSFRPPKFRTPLIKMLYIF